MTMRGQICFFASFFLVCTTLFIGLGYNARNLRPDIQDYIEHQQAEKQYKMYHKVTYR